MGFRKSNLRISHIWIHWKCFGSSLENILRVLMWQWCFAIFYLFLFAMFSFLCALKEEERSLIGSILFSPFETMDQIWRFLIIWSNILFSSSNSSLLSFSWHCFWESFKSCLFLSWDRSRCSNFWSSLFWFPLYRLDSFSSAKTIRPFLNLPPCPILWTAGRRTKRRKS